jgi:hypothetical protein
MRRRCIPNDAQPSNVHFLKALVGFNRVSVALVIVLADLR